jgi:hypothetical protein
MTVRGAVDGIVWARHIERLSPVALWGTYQEYEVVAREMSNHATKALVWTFYGTPLAPNAEGASERLAQKEGE